MKRGPGRRGYPSQANRNRAETLLAQALDEAHREGMLLALAEVERQVYSSETLEEFFGWLHGALRQSAEDEAKSP